MTEPIVVVVEPPVHPVSPVLLALVSFHVRLGPSCVTTGAFTRNLTQATVVVVASLVLQAMFV